MEKYFPILKKCVLFDGIEEDKLWVMLNCLGAKITEFDKKYTIVAEGKTPKLMGILLSGAAQINRCDYFGNRSIVSTIAPADTFGEEFSCAQVDSIPVSVVANSPCEVMFIDCSHILHTCHNNCAFHQKLIFNLMKNMAAKNVGYYNKLEIISKRTTREKLIAYLSHCARKSQSNSFDIPFDRQELADYLEVERSGLSSEIGKLRDEGLIISEKKHFELLM